MLVIFEFQPFQSDGVYADETDQVAGQLSGRIEAFRFLDNKNPFDAQFLYATGLFGGYPPGDPAEILHAGQFFLDRHLIRMEDGGESCGRFTEIGHFGRIGADGIGHDGGGQLFSIPVKDNSAVGLQLEGLGMLIIGEGFQCFA